MRGAVLQLHRWGLLPQIIAAGTPAVRRTTFHVGNEPTLVDIKPSYGVDALYAPRRTVLDPILADAAIAAGAEIRYGSTVIALRRDRSGRVIGITGHDAEGRSFDATAAITIGADGMTPPWPDGCRRPSSAPAAQRRFVYGHWSGVAADGYDWFFRPGAAARSPTNDSQACVFVGTTPQRFRGTPPQSVDGYLACSRPLRRRRRRLADAGRPDKLHRFPVASATSASRGDRVGQLVGDAGYFKDPIAAHGLTDALRDAELLAAPSSTSRARPRRGRRVRRLRDDPQRAVRLALHDRRLHRLLHVERHRGRRCFSNCRSR
jgi:2-polyprenyl-6-methoxyphenol hydroxylase-like FAD-dependent oxidoreductase